MRSQIETLAYLEALKLAALVGRLSTRFPQHYESVRADLRRTALAIPVNVSRGDSAKSPECDRYYTVALNSALRCEAILHTCQAIGLIARWDFPQVQAVLNRVFALVRPTRDSADDRQLGRDQHRESTGMLASVSRLASAGLGQ